MKVVVWLCGALSCFPFCTQAAGTSGPVAGKRVLAVIGVGDYQNSEVWHSIQAAEESARGVLKVLPDAFGYEVAGHALLGSSATAGRVSEYLDRVVSGLSAEDDLVVYFAGHGVEGYLVPFDAQPDAGPAGLLRIRSILEKLDNARSRNILVILDACDSGVAVPPSGPGRNREDRTGMSRVVITSSAAQQSAIADGRRGATLFSGILLDLLETGRCDISGDGYCTATELALLVRRRLAAHSTKQTPTVGVFGGDESADFRLYRYGAEAREWAEARTCTTSECAETSKLVDFMKKHPVGVYSAAAKELLRDRVERAIRRSGQGVTSDLRLVSGDAAQQSVTLQEDEDEFVFMWIPDKEAPFWMEKLEVSVDQYRRFSRGLMPRAPSFNRNWSEGKQPMVNVSWPQAQAFCASIGGTLPSVEQWAFAAHANKSHRFPWNDDNDDTKLGLVNLAGAKYDNHLFSAPVGEYKDGENGWRIRNLIGNVSEWTSNVTKTLVGPKAVVVGGSFADTWEKVDLKWQREVELAGSNTVGFRCIVLPERQP